MTNNETQAFILRLVRQKHGELRQATASLLKEMAGDNMDRKKALASWVQRQARISQCPFRQGRSTVAHYSHRVLANVCGWPDVTSLISWIALLPGNHSCDNHRWVFEEEDESAFDFDAIYERFKGESRLPELFDQVVRTLEEIHASGGEQRHHASSAWQSHLYHQKCKDGSYFSLNGAWEFLLSFLKNYL